ncbi:MAG: isochorismate synthase [Ignavibacteriales bacterium]|nr:isochorismate synthase [Ignavibacteriales bacterium]
MGILEKLELFYNLNKKKRNSILSFAYKVPEINFLSIVRNIECTKKYFYWSKEQIEFLCLDDIYTCNKIRKKNITSFSNQHIHNFNNTLLAQAPLIVGANKFPDNKESRIWNDFKKDEWYIPKYIFYKNKNSHHLIINTQSNKAELQNIQQDILKLLDYNCNKSASNKSRASIIKIKNDNEFKIWKKEIKNILNEIKNNKVQKVVLSRCQCYKLFDFSNVDNLIRMIKYKYPENYSFVFKKNNSIFFGASPEKLVKVKNGILEADALAGSIERGKTKKEDKLFEEVLIKSKKNISEQKAVVDFILSKLKNITVQIKHNKNPKIKKLTFVQHLLTNISAKLNENYSVLSIIKHLHPTPAICGVPTQKALQIIRKSEKHERGLYCGAIGWLNFANNGEIAVAIRSALLNNKKLYVFSGCGIVEGSTPEEEFKESELKMKTIISLFNTK